MNTNLIFDIGLHVGQDTAFYLQKGFKVVAIEANPMLVSENRKKFEREIESGALVIVNVGVADKGGLLPFYVNSELSEWSSFDHQIGTTRGRYSIIDVPVVALRSIVDRYGTPYYIKIDIEGMDYAAIQSLRGLDDMPRYISVENGQEHMIKELQEQGYVKFKFVNQAHIHEIALQAPAREGNYVAYKFPFGASGPLGAAIDGE